MTKTNGRQAAQRERGATPLQPRRRLCGPGTPANVIGSALLFLFTYKLFTTSPFESLTVVNPHDDPAARRLRGGFVEVSKKSHAYLQQAFWDRRPGDFTANVSGRFEPADEAARQQLSAQQSSFLEWIRQDLTPWKDSGITHEGVEAASMMFDDCDGEMLRFQVLNGSLWVHHITDRLEGGWYPGAHGPGNVAAKGRIPYTVLAVMQTLRVFPGQVPDVDVVLHTADFPCIPKSSRSVGSTGAPVPVLGYQGSKFHWDIPFPDPTYWGNEWQYLQDPWGNPAHGWGNQAELLARKYENVSLLDRIPQASWRGRTKDDRYPERDELRRVFVGCVDKLKAAGRPEDAALLNVLNPPLVLQDTCDYRYSMYIESQAYASNLKQKMACGSVLVALRMDYWDIFTRAMQPGREYVLVGADEEALCEQMVTITRDMNAAFDSRGRREMAAGTGSTPTLARQVQEMRKDPLLKKLLAGEGEEARPPRPVAGANYSWGSAAMPWQIAQNGQRFILERLRMQDVLLYIRDLLRAYAALQRRTIHASPKARCYTGDMLLEQFWTPYEGDGRIVEAAYPWLRGWDGGCRGPAAAQQHS